jgi:predicted dehydrogenase
MLQGEVFFYDLASHQLDFLDFLFGEMVEVKGVSSNRAGFYNVEDCVSASFRFNSGVIGCGQWSFVTANCAAEDIMEIIGTKGKIVFSGFAQTPIKLITDAGELDFPYLNPENIQYNLIKQVVEAVRGKSLCNSTGVAASRTNWAMEQIVKN